MTYAPKPRYRLAVAAEMTAKGYEHLCVYNLTDRMAAFRLIEAERHRLGQRCCIIAFSGLSTPPPSSKGGTRVSPVYGEPRGLELSLWEKPREQLEIWTIV